MKQYLFGLIAAPVLACAGADSTELDAGPQTWIDYPEADLSALPGDPAFTGAPDGDVGQASEAWVSDRYHGQTNGAGPCYGPATGGWPCEFPQYKQINVSLVLANSTCSQHQSYILSHGGTQAEYQAIVTQFQLGLASLGGIGSGVVVNLNSTSGTHMTIGGDCEHTGSAFGNFYGSWFNVSDVQLPASGGVDPDKVFYWDTASSALRFSPENIWAHVVSTCNFPTVGNPLRIANMKTLAYRVGRHEGLHMFGFAHFRSGMMAPTVGCNFSGSDFDIPAGFGAALSDYSGGAGSVTVKPGSINPANVPNGECTSLSCP